MQAEIVYIQDIHRIYTGLTYFVMAISSQSKLMRMDAVTEILTTKEKDKNLGCKRLKLTLAKKP